MRIAVLGGGSLGLLLAGRLSAFGCSAEIWTNTEEQAARLNAEGLTVEDTSGQASVHVKLRALPFRQAPPFPDGPILLAVKQTALTSNFLQQLARVVPLGGTIVLFQNGIGHVERIEQALPGRNVIAAVTTEAALRLDPVTVRHTGRGEIRLGRWRLSDQQQRATEEEKQEADFQPLVHLLKQAGFSVSLSKQMEEAMLRKLLVNAVINPLTAILRVNNGELIQTPERLELMKALFLETYEILSRYGLREETELWDHVMQVCAATKHNQSSMLQDVSLGRPTEIESINGQICRLATEQGREAPWNAAVTALVKAAN